MVKMLMDGLMLDYMKIGPNGNLHLLPFSNYQGLISKRIMVDSNPSQLCTKEIDVCNKRVRWICLEDLRATRINPNETKSYTMSMFRGLCLDDISTIPQSHEQDRHPTDNIPPSSKKLKNKKVK